MDTMQAIRMRHSVRSYTGEPLAAEHVEQLNYLINETNREHGLHIQLITDTNGAFSIPGAALMGWKNVPALIALIGPDTDNLDEACGYAGEHIVIEAQKMGLNTCWAGMYRKKKLTAQVNDGERICLVIAIGYGKNQGRQHRSKSFNQVATISSTAPRWFVEGVDCALLAPTAVNQQKFCFHLTEDETVTMSTEKGAFCKVDMGIARYHFEAATGRKVQRG